MNHLPPDSYYIFKSIIQGADLMKLERISANKIKYSISFEELSGKGFLQDEMLKESFIWDDLFDEMLDEASKIYELETDGSVSIEIFSLTAKELVLILTLDEHELNGVKEEETVINTENKIIVFQFDELEDSILLSKALHNLNLTLVPSSLYYFKDQYYLLLSNHESIHDGLVSVCKEYGRIATITHAFLKEYGKLVVDEIAFDTLARYF